MDRFSHGVAGCGIGWCFIFVAATCGLCKVVFQFETERTEARTDIFPGCLRVFHRLSSVGLTRVPYPDAFGLTHASFAKIYRFLTMT